MASTAGATTTVAIAAVTTTDRTATAARTLLRRGVGPLIAVLLATAGCSDSDSVDAPSSTTPGDAVATTPAPTAAPTPAATTTAVTTLTPPDAATALQQAFDQVAAGYHFVTTVTVNGAVQLAAEGDHVGAGTRMSVTSNGTTIGYIVAPEGTWVFDAGAWQELEDPAPVTDPVSNLRTPLSVAVTAWDGTTAQITGSYTPALLGLVGDAPVNVVFTITTTTLQAVAYSAPVASGLAEVRADITRLVDTTPVTIPEV